MVKRFVFTVGGKSVFLFLFCVLFFVAVFCCFFHFLKGEKIIPEQLFAQSIQETLTSRTFRYQLEVRTDEQVVISKVDGEWVSPNNVYIKGEMYNTPVEFIQLGEKIYMKDFGTKKWLDLEESVREQVQLYIMELGPLFFLTFKNVLDLYYLGQEKDREGKMLLLECKAFFQEPFLGEQSKEYRLKFWISARDHRLRQVLIKPVEIQKKKPFQICLRLWDYNQSMVIKPPVKS